MELTQKQKDNISKYLESRLGMYGIRAYDFEWRLTPNYTFKEYATHTVKLENCGILKHMLESCNLEVKIWYDKDNRPFLAQVSFSYTHVGGGSNGHDTHIKLKITSDNVYEVEQ